MLFAHVKADYCFGVTLAIRKPTSPTLIGASIIATFMVLVFRAAGTWGKLRGDESLLISDAVRHGFVAIPDLIRWLPSCRATNCSDSRFCFARECVSFWTHGRCSLFLDF